MKKRDLFLLSGLGFTCLVLVTISYKLFDYHSQLQELLSIVQHDGLDSALEQNIVIPSVTEKLVGRTQVWRPVQEAVKDAVVQILVQGAEFDMLQPYKTPRQFSASGSGFFINEEGEIATNCHVVKHAKAIWIQIPSLGKRIIDATVIGESPDRDLALLKITDEGKEIIKTELGKISYLKIGNSDILRRADEVMAVGYPVGGQALKSTTGVISGREGGLIQISAAINPGNSGGPLLNLNGEVVGINSSKMTGASVDNIGYIIPVNDFRIILDDLKTMKLVRRPFLGILFNNGSEMLTEYLGNPQPGGCYVADVIQNSTLDKAGVKTGDMIYEINGHQVDIFGDMNVLWSEDKISLVDYVSRLSLGEDINLVIYRNGERKKISVKFTEGQLPAIRPVFPWIEDVDYEVFAGMVVMQLTGNHLRGLVNQAPGLMYYSELKNQMDPALIVTHVFPTSQLYRTRTIVPGAIINEVNGKEVRTLDELREAYLVSDDKHLTIRATDRYARASDNVLVVLPLPKLLQEEAQLSQTFHYPITPNTQKLLARYAQKVQKQAGIATS